MKMGFLLGVLFTYAPLSLAKDLLEIEITSGIRSQQKAVAIPARIEVITREEIEASGATHIAEALRGRGAVQLTDTFGDGSRSNIGMRGFGDTANANTLILVDGRRLNNSDLASPDLNSVSLKDVERIEIIQGSASVLYGDQAVGGVINIITRRPDEKAVSAQLGYGSYDSYKMQAQFSDRLNKNLSLRLSTEIRESGGYRDHNKLQYENLFGVIEYEYNQGSVFAEFQTTDESLHTPGALFASEARLDRKLVRPEYQNDFIDTKTQVFRAGVKHSLNDHWKLETELTYRESDGEFLQSSRNAPEVLIATQRRRVNSFNPRMIGHYDFNGGGLLLTLGYDQDDTRYRLSSRFGPQSNDQLVSSWYGQAVVPVNKKIDVSFGARRSKVNNEISDGFAFLTPTDIDDTVSVNELGFSYRPDVDWRWYGRVAETYRFAKVDEHTLYFGPGTLQNQVGTSREAGIEYAGKDLRAAMNIYHLGLDNEIAFDGSTGGNINLAETRRRGFSVDIDYQLNHQWAISSNYNYVNAEVTVGTFARNDVPMVSSKTFRGGLNYRLNTYWQFYGELQATGERVYSGDFNNALGKLAGYGVVNFKAGYQRNNWQIDARINNILDKRYAEFGARYNDFSLFPVISSHATVQPSPERNLWLSARYQFH